MAFDKNIWLKFIRNKKKEFKTFRVEEGIWGNYIWTKFETKSPFIAPKGPMNQSDRFYLWITSDRVVEGICLHQDKM